MPTITFYQEHRAHEVDAGANLREAMRTLGISPYSGLAMFTNCHGHNFCGTCAVTIADGKGASSRGQDEEATLRGNLAIAYVAEKNLRLACQTTVVGDMIIGTHPLRIVDRKETRARLAFAGIACGFGLLFAGVLAALFLDMIKIL